MADNPDTSGSPAGSIAHFQVPTGQRPWIIAYCFSAAVSAVLQTIWIHEFILLVGDAYLAIPAFLAAFMAAHLTGQFALYRWPNLLPATNFPVLLLLITGMALSSLMTPLLLEVFDYVHVLLLGRQELLPTPPGLHAAIYYFFAGYCVTLVPMACAGATLTLYLRSLQFAHDSAVQGHQTVLIETSAGLAAGFTLGWFLILPHFRFYNSLWVIVLVSLIFCISCIAICSAGKKGSGIGESPSGRSNNTTRDAPISFNTGRTGPAEPVVPSIAPGTLLTLFFAGVALSIQYTTFTNILIRHQGNLHHATAAGVIVLLCGIGIGTLCDIRLRLRLRSGKYSPSLAYTLAALISAILSAVFSFLGASVTANAYFIIMALSLLFLPISLFSGMALHNTVAGHRAQLYAPAASGYRCMLPWLAGFPVGMAITGGFLSRGTNISWILMAAVYLYISSAMTSLKHLQAGAVRISLLLLLLIAAGITLHVSDGQQIRVTGMGRYRELQYLGSDNIAEVYISHESDGSKLRVNGIAEALIGNPNGPPQNDPMRWLTALPFALHPTAENMLIAGSAGVTAIQDLPPLPGYVDIVETSATVLASFTEIHNSRTLFRNWQTPRVYSHHNDLRNLLSLTERSYDIIVISPQSPARRGSEQLHTLEFIQQVRRHLRQGGIYIQGFIPDYMTNEQIRKLAGIFLECFTDVQMFQATPGMLYLLASNVPLEPRIIQLSENSPLREQIEYFSRSGINTVEDLLLAWLMNRKALEGFADNAYLAAEDQSSFSEVAPMQDDPGTRQQTARLVHAHDILLNPEGPQHTEQDLVLNWVYVAGRLLSLGFPDRAVGLQPTVKNTESRLLISALLNEYEGRPGTAEDLLLEAIDLAPQNQEARYLLVQNYLDDLANGSAPSPIKEIARELRGPPLSITRIWSSYLGNDWYSLLPFERELARVEPQDPWYAEAALLRASWRIHIDSPDYRRAMLKEAIRIIDRSLSSYYSGRLYLARAKAAYLLGQSETVMETASIAASKYEHLPVTTPRSQKPRLLHRLLASRSEAAEMFSTITQAAKMPATGPQAERLHHRYTMLLDRLDTAITRLRQTSTE